MGHCACTPTYCCPWCRPAIDRAEAGPEAPFEAWDINAETAALYGGAAW